jgi:lysozyme
MLFLPAWRFGAPEIIFLQPQQAPIALPFPFRSEVASMSANPIADALRAILDLQRRILQAGTREPAPRRIGPDGVALIKRFEGCARRRPDGLLEAYPDPATGGAPWTIGWGATGEGIARGTVWTQQQCDARLEADLARYAAEVAAVIADAPTSQAQFDAMVSFHYNTGAIARSTLARRHVAGDYEGAAREFDRWIHASGRVMKGLVRRRAAEAALYRSAT